MKENLVFTVDAMQTVENVSWLENMFQNNVLKVCCVVLCCVVLCCVVLCCVVLCCVVLCCVVLCCVVLCCVVLCCVVLCCVVCVCVFHEAFESCTSMSLDCYHQTAAIDIKCEPQERFR